MKLLGGEVESMDLNNAKPTVIVKEEDVKNVSNVKGMIYV